MDLVRAVGDGEGRNAEAFVALEAVAAGHALAVRCRSGKYLRYPARADDRRTELDVGPLVEVGVHGRRAVKYVDELDVRLAIGSIQRLGA